MFYCSQAIWTISLLLKTFFTHSKDKIIINQNHLAAFILYVVWNIQCQFGLDFLSLPEDKQRGVEVINLYVNLCTLIFLVVYLLIIVPLTPTPTVVVSTYRKQD